ncbi:phosphopentomutase [Paenibacillus sp. HB172176]|uniref:phosphopentomutase n=1 Tax=Paenibacillus sp. HB172176 TaxID=2493690 RepID=UPI00143A142C|nr:phosphopentomutase [Paenibacillus sp. HB172176]
MKFRRIAVIVLDSVGIGELPDAPDFGDAGSNTLGHIAERVPSLKLPHMRSLGLGRIAPIADWSHEPKLSSSAYYGKMAEVSSGKDTMTGHWELMGLKIEVPFRTFPDGFPEELIQAFEGGTGRKVIGNKSASGTAILDELGEEQMKSGAWIVYTSADSVFQIAAHEEIIPLEELYEACKLARRLTSEERFAVGRVIARPYIGMPGSFQRTPHRHDYAVKPPQPTVLSSLKDKGLDVIAVGKINDIFDGEGITEASSTVSNEDGIRQTIERLGQPFRGLLFTNLVEFDSLYGHRRDPEGYAAALEQFDQAVPALLEQLTQEDLLVITADHGNDPTYAGTDHTREYVPVLLYSPAFGNGGELQPRSTFADLGATIADNFDAPPPPNGSSFLSMLHAKDQS